MRKLIITTVAIVGLLTAASRANADSSRFELYYNDYITKKIVNCKRIAARLVEAKQSTAMLTTFNEIDMTRVQEILSGGILPVSYWKTFGVKNVARSK